MDRRPRSPSHPFISLRTSFERVLQLHATGSNFATRADAARLWNRSHESSAIAQTISALSQFGLISVEGRGPERKLQLSGLALRILSSPDVDRDALCEAALKPETFAKIWKHIRAGINSREELVGLLTRDRDHPFNLKAAEEAVRVFEDSARFAGLPLDLSDLRVAAHPPVQQTTEGFPAEEVIALGKIRIHYRSRPDRLDYEEALSHFEAKLRRMD